MDSSTHEGIAARVADAMRPVQDQVRLPVAVLAKGP